MRILVVPLLLVQLATAAVANIALAGCESKCSDVDVPYPFGTSYSCQWTGFKVTCDRAYQPPRLFLESHGPEVMAISVRNSTVRVRATAWSFAAAGNVSGGDDVRRVRVLPAKLRPYVLSAARNSLVVVGCGFQVAATSRATDSAQHQQGAPPTTFGSCALACPAAAGEQQQLLSSGVPGATASAAARRPSRRSSCPSVSTLLDGAGAAQHHIGQAAYEPLMLG